jgi:hypothetical protein
MSNRDPGGIFTTNPREPGHGTDPVEMGRALVPEGVMRLIITLD